MAPPAPIPKKEDSDLWLSYALALKPLLAPEGLGAKGAVYIPPLSSVGITGGPPGIPQVVQNLGIYDVADNMLDPSTPVFNPAGTSYFKTIDAFSAWIQLNTNSGKPAQDRLEAAQKKLDKAQGEYVAANKKAHAEYKRAIKDKEINADMTFDQYISDGNFPSYQTAWDSQQAAAQKVDAEISATSGENWKQVQSLISGIRSAESKSLIPGYNMPAADASAIDVTHGGVPTNGQYFVPAYRIQDTYTGAVADWKTRFNDPSFKAGAKTISFSAEESASKDWSNLGFTENDVHASGSYSIFFSATYTSNEKQVTEYVSAHEAGSGLRITIKARGYDVFTVTPGKWDVPDLSVYKLKDNAPATLRRGMVKVQSVLMGYGISMDIQLDASSKSTTKVKELLEKARSTAGHASFFGYNIGLGGSGESKTTSSVNFDDVKGASSGNTISIPPQDNTYPTVLAVLGRKVDTTVA